MRPHSSSRRGRLVAALLVASVTVFALAASFHRHDPSERTAGGETLAAAKSGELQQAAPCIACLVAHTVPAFPVVQAVAPAPRLSIEFLLHEPERVASFIVGTSHTPRGPPAPSTTPLAA